MDKHVILGIIILSIGTFGGIVRFLNTTDLSKKINYRDLLKNILTGIGSAMLVPLFLNMLSSDLIKKDEIETLNYFIFSGFCFIAAYLSDRFIISMGERIMREVDKVKQNQKSTKETVDLLVENESEPDTDEGQNEKITDKIAHVFNELDSKVKRGDDDIVNDVLNTFREGKYKFRTIRGIANELKYPENIIQTIIKVFEDNGLIRKVRRMEDGKIFYGITNLGKFMNKNKQR